MTVLGFVDNVSTAVLKTPHHSWLSPRWCRDTVVVSNYRSTRRRGDFLRLRLQRRKKASFIVVGMALRTER